MMIDANNANKKTRENITNNLQKDLKKIEIEIEKSIKNGSFECYFDGKLSLEIKQYLKELGYKINSGIQYNCEYNVISWKNIDKK